MKTESANAGDKSNNTGTDLEKSLVQEANISESTLSDRTINESIEILSRIEGTKADDEQDLHENQKSFKGIIRNAAPNDKPQVQETFIFESIPSAVKNSERRETLNRVELMTSTDKQSPVENRDFSEEITGTDNGAAKTEGQEAHLPVSILQEFKNKESIVTDRVKVAIAPEAAQYPLENLNFPEEITKTTTTSDESNDTGNDSIKSQVQKQHISGKTSQDIINNESIETNMLESDKLYPLENQNCIEENTQIVSTSNEPMTTDCDSNKTSVKENAIRSNENKTTDPAVLIENQKMLLESGNKNESEAKEIENTSHNNASLIFEKHASPSLEPLKFDNLSHTINSLRETSLTVKPNDLNIEFSSLEVAAVESTMVSDGEKKSAGSESLELKAKLLTESAERIVPEMDKEEIIILNKKNSTILSDKNDRITVNENGSKVQYEDAPLTSSVAKEKMKDVHKGSKVMVIKTNDSLMNAKVTESNVKDSRPTTILDPHAHSKDSKMDETIKQKAAIEFTDQIQNQTSGVVQNQTLKESEVVLTSKQTQSLVDTSIQSYSKKFEQDLENAKKMLSSTGHETKRLELNLNASSLPQKPTDKADLDKNKACHAFNKPCTITSNSCNEKPTIPNTLDPISNKTGHIEVTKQIEVLKKNISNSDKGSGIIVNETITKQKSPGNIKSLPNLEIQKVECSATKTYQHENDFPKISPALPDSFNTSPTLPSISTSSPTPSNFSGIFSKKSSHLSPTEEDFHKLKKKSLHFSTRPREFIIPAASVLCNVDNLENATKLNKKLHWELLDNKNELTEIEDDTDIETTDEERHKLKGEIKQEQVTPQESPQQSPKDDQDEQSNPLYKADALRNSQEENYKATQNLPPKTHKSKQYKYKLSKTIKSKPVKSVTPSSFMDQKPFTIVLPKRQRGRPRKLENLLKATIKAKAGPRILKKRGRKPKKPIEFTESYDNNSTECAEPVIDAVSPKDKIANTLVSEGECALNVKENEELLAEPPIQIRNNCDVISHHEEEKSRQSSCELNDENKQQISLEDRNRTCFTRDQVISNESIIKDVVAGTNKDSTTDDQNFNFESKKIPKESNTKMSANKPRTLSLNSDNNCDDISTTSGDSENKLLIISDGGGPEEINEKQAEEVRTQEKVSSTKSKPLLERFEERKSSLNKKDKKYITLEEIGIKVRPFKGHLSTLRIPKVNKDADQTNAWKLEAYEELDKQQREEKLEQKIESEMNGSTTMVKAANKGFLATYRIPKIKRDAGHGKDILEKTETCGKTPKEERREKVDESYHETVNKNSESKGKLNNNCKVTEAKSIDKTKHIWRPEKTEKIKKTYKQQRDDECGNSAETGKRKLFNLETYNAVDQEDKIENAEGKLNGPKVNEKETPCNKGKPTKLRRKSLNLPRKMLAISSDEEEIKHLENVDAKNSLERNLLHTRKKASLHRRILDSSCDEDKEEKSTNKTHKTLKQRRKSMFVESTSFETDFHHTDESINDKKPTSNNLVKTTSGSETFDSEKNVDVLSSSENNHILKTTVESMDSVIMLSANDCKDTGIKNSLKIRRKSLFIESSSSETIALDNTRLSDVMLYNTAHMKLRNDSDNIFESANDSIKEPTIKNKNDDIELKPTKLLKSRRKSMHVEPNCASNLKNSSEDSNKTNEMLIKPKEKTLKIRRTSEVMKTTSINENPKKESSSIEPFDRENGLREEISNPNEPILEQNKIEEPVNTNEITNDLNSSTEQFPLKPRRKSSNHRRILDSSSDDNEPLMKKPLLNEPYVNEIKPPLASTELKTKSRKRRIVKVLSTSRDAINSSANSSLQSENLIQILSNSPSPYASPLHNHPIFNTEVSTQSHEFVASMPVTPNQQDDDKKFKEIDSKLHQIFQSPQYTSDYKANHNTTTDSNIMEMLSTSSSDGQGKNITAEVSLDPNRENDQSSANVDLNKPYLSPHTNTTDSIKLDMISTSLANAQGIDASPGETQPDTNQENNQSSVNINTTAVSHNCSEIKHLSLGSAEYRFEKVSDNVVNLFISRKRKRKRRN